MNLNKIFVQLHINIIYFQERVIIPFDNVQVYLKS